MPAASNCFWYPLVHVRAKFIVFPRSDVAETNVPLVDFLEDVLESTVVFLQDGILRGQELETPQSRT